MRVKTDRKSFWNPPLWKWAVFLALLAASAYLLRHKPAPAPVKVEILPFTDSPPAWDGSYPYLVISTTAETSPLKFNASIVSIKPTLKHDHPVNQFAVDLHSGRFVLKQTDLFVPDVVPLSLTRTYTAWDPHSRAFGVAANHPYDICPTGTRNPYTYMDLNLEDSYQVHMPRISKGTGFADAVFRHSETASEFYGAKVSWNGDGWTMDLRDGSKLYFPEAYNAKTFAEGAPTAMVDSQAHRIQLKRSSTRNLEQIVSPNGRTISLKYDSADRIVEARDDAGHLRTYTYDGTGHLKIVSDESHILYGFEYAPLIDENGFDRWLMTAVRDASGKVLLHNSYLWGRVSKQKLANGQVYRYDYQLRGTEVTQCTVVLPSGEKRVFSF